MGLTTKKGASSALMLVGFIVAIIIIIEVLPYASEALGIFSPPQPAGLQVTQGVAVYSIDTPSSVSPSTNFNVNFLVKNNINGKPASNIKLCLDNLGLFKLVTSPNMQGGQPQQCTIISTLFTGGSLPEYFTLLAPSNSYYANIPYTPNLGYFLDYSYSASAAQSLEFVSQTAYSSNNYPAPSYGSFDNTAGPISITTTATQPAIYNTAMNLQLNLANVGNGIVLGQVQVTVSINPSVLSMSQGSLGLTQLNSTTFRGNFSLGVSGLTLTLPLTLNSTRQSAALSAGVPYLSSNVHVAISYTYEIDGYFPVSLNVQKYFVQ
ncbi:MAG: hypothetical protein M1348_00450 [Candidatus Parvarchaeota archaeon]|nr:hypothetical protein [Candidatus Parvarchaeota archaeon]